MISVYSCIGIVGIRLLNRAESAPELQTILTKYGDAILSRSGVPSPDKITGVISLTCSAPEERIASLVEDLTSVSGVSASYMMLVCSI